MISVTVALVGLVLLFLVGFFFHVIFFAVLKDIGNSGNLPPEQYLNSLATGLIYSTGLLVVSLISAFGVIGLHLYNNWKIYLVIGMVAIASESHLEYGSKTFEVIDKETTQYGVPIYREVVLPILNFFRVIYRLIVPWLNTINSVGTIILRTFVNVAWNCVEQNWSNTITRAAGSIESIFISIANFLISLGSDDFDLATPISEITGFFASLEEMWSCQCKELSFASKWILNNFNDPSFAQAIDRTVNSVIELIRILVRTFRDLFLFGLDFFTCSNVSPTSAQIQCLAERQPNFGGFGDRVCGSIEGFTRLFDVGLRNGIYSFVPNIFPVPRTAPFIGNSTCGVVLLATNILDIIFHIDIVFPLPGYPDVRYLQYVDTNKPLKRAWDAAEGIQLFWSDFRTNITTDIGCALASTFNITVNIADTITRFVIQLTVDPDEILDWMKNENANITNIEQDILNIGTCGERVANELNEPFGSWINQTVVLIQRFGRIWLNLIPNIPTFPTFVSDGLFKTDLSNFFFEVDAWAITTGNVIRQFDHIGVSNCPLRDGQLDQDTPAISGIELFCCMGSLVESSIRTLKAVVRYLVFVIIDFSVGETAETVFIGGSGDLEQEIIPRTKDLLNSFACILPSFFSFAPGNGECPNNSTNTIQDSFYAFSSSFVEVFLVPIKIVDLIITIIVKAINNLPIDVCQDILIPLYNLSFGILAEVIRGFSVALDCLIDSGIFKDIGDFVYSFFGPNGTFISDICTFIQFIIDAIEFFINLFKAPDGVVVELFNQLKSEIEDLFDELINVFEDFFNDTIADFQEFQNDVTAAFNCLKNGANDFFSQFGDCVVCVFTTLSSCGDDCSFDLSSCSISKRSINEQKEEDQFARFKRTSVPTRSDSVSDPLFNYQLDEPESPCYQQILAAKNLTYSSDMLRLFQRDASACLQSVLFSKMIDRFLLLQLNNTLPNVVNPYTFYDPVAQTKTIRAIFSGIRSLMDYQAKFLVDTIDYTGSRVPGQSVYSNPTWLQYAQQQGVSDPLSIRIGQIGELIFRNMKNNESNRKFGIISLFTKSFYFFWKYTIGIWTTPASPTNSISQVARAMKRGFQRLPELSNSLSVVRNSITNSTGYAKLAQFSSRIAANTFEWIKNNSQTDDETLLKNRKAFSTIYDYIKVTIENKKRYYNFQNLTKETIFATQTRFEPFYDMQNQDMTFALRKGNLTGSHSDCLNSVCINCTFLHVAVDKLIDLIIHTLNDSQRTLDTDQDFAINGNSIPKKEKFSIEDPDLSSFRQLRSGSSSSGNVAISFLEAITFYSIDWRYVGDYTAYFFGVSDENDKNSWKFWVLFFTTCDYDTMPRCAENSAGLGFYNSFGYFLFIFGIAFIFFSILIPGSGVIVFVIGLIVFFPFILSVGYSMSPWCALPKFPTALPLLPDCMGDDIFQGFKSLDKDCLDWTSALPNITTSTCPTNTEGYKREFPDWKRQPYLFKDGLRNLLFLAEWQVPAVTDFLRNTDIIIFSWFRNIDYFNQLLTFDFGSTGIDDTWKTYFFVTIHAIFVPMVLFGGSLFAAFVLISPIFLLAIGILSITSAMFLFLISVVLGILVSGNNRQNYLREYSEYNLLYT